MAASSKKPIICLYMKSDIPSEQMQLLEEHFIVITEQDKNLCSKYKNDVIAIVPFAGSLVSDEILEKYPNLRIISNNSVGYDHIDLHAAAKRGIRVGNTPLVLNEATAEIAISLILSTARRIVEGDRICRLNDTNQFSLNTFLGTGVSGQTLGIVGMGGIGRVLARMAHCGFNMKILYHNRHRAAGDIEQSIGGAEYYKDVYEMLPVCDFVVLLAPSTPETYKMFGKKEFSRMKQSAIFVNISRGTLVDHDALVSALEEGVIKGAGLDVTDPEPLPRDHKLLTFPNVVLTPHIGSATAQTRLKMMQVVVDNIEAVLNDKPMMAEVQLPKV